MAAIDGGARVCCAALVLALVAAGSAAVAQSTGAIRLAVGSAAGGAIDVYSRIIAEPMAAALSRPVLIEIKSGTNGNLAAQWVNDGPADGSLIWVGTQSMLEINPSAYKNLRWKQSDFIPVIKGIDTPLVLVVHPSVPAKTWEDWLDYAKTNRGKLSYASYSPGTVSHFLAYQVNERFNLDLTHVPYKGAAPQITDLIAGHALFGFTQLQSAMEPVRGGLLRALVLSGPQRSRFLPDVPTFAELGLADLTATAWFGLFVKTGTPPDTLIRLASVAKAAHADPAIQERLRAQGFEVVGEAGPDFQRSIEVQTERWARIVKASGFSAD